MYDEYALWGGQGTYYFTYPLTEDSAQGVVTGSRTTPVMTSPGPYISGDPLSTLAVDGGGANGERTPRMYAWTWGDGRTVGNWPAGYPTPWTDYIPIAAYDEGQTTGKVHFVPTPRVSSGLSTAYNYWSGGEVYQSTGELYLSSGECAGINASFRLAIYDPTTGTTRGSGKLVPNTAADDIFAAADGCWPSGYVASDMAIDAEGNFYLTVKGAGNTVYLVRVVPGADQAQWRYNVVGQMKNADGSNYVSDGFYGMAFHNGQLYLQATRDWSTAGIVRVDPLSMVVQARTSDTSLGQDLAAAQTAPVLDGVVYNDANGNGVIDSGETGLAGQTVALYDDAGTLLGTRQTDGAGNYSFILNSSSKTYQVRLAQPQVNGVNAVQTYAAGRSSGSINSVTAHCLRGDFRDTSGACEGRIAMPAADPSVGAIGGTENLDAMPILSTVTVNTPMEVTSADFGVYAAGTGSWGDAAFSSTAAQQGPRLYDYDPDSTLRLGDTRGEFTDGSTTNNHATDDGVAIAGPNGRIALQDNTTILAVGNEYDVIGNLQGDAAGNAQLSAWLAATNSPSDFRTNSTSTTGQAGSAAQKYLYAGADDAVATLQVPTSPDPAGGLSSTWLRAVATDADSITEPDNTNGQYQPAQGSAAANTTPWVNRGEIEDYRVSIANAVIRVAATTLNEVADGDFGYQLTGPISTTAPSANSVTFRPSLSNALTYSPVSHAVSNVGQDVSVANNTIPEGWSLVGAKVVDTKTGAEVPGSSVNLNTRQVSIPGSAITRGSDLTVEYTYSSGADASRSSWTLEPLRVTADGTQAAVATATINDSRGEPMAGADVSFSAPEGVQVSDVTDHGDGTYTATFTATTLMSADIRAFVVQNGSPTELPESPKTVNFVAGAPVVGEGLSSVSIDDQDPRAADGVASHTITTVLRDAHGNGVTGSAGDLAGTSTQKGVTVSAFTETGTPGIYTATVRSTVAGDHPVTVSYNGDLVIGTVTAVYAAGAPDLAAGASALTAQTTGNRTVSDPATVVVESVDNVHTAAVTLIDANRNPVAGVPVQFAINGTAVALGSTEVTTGADGVALLHLASSTAGSSTVTASVNGVAVQPGAGVSFAFVAGAPVVGEGGSSITASTGAVEANGKATHSVTVKAVDAFGNLVQGAEVEFSLPEGLTPTGSVTGTTGADGTYRVLVSSTTARTYEVTATVNGEQITEGSPATVTFITGAVSAARSSWAVTPESAQEVGAQFTATVQLNDATGNAVGAGQEVSFTVPTGVSVVESGPYLSDDKGQVVVHLTSTTAGSFPVSAYVGADRIGSAHTLVFTAGSPDLSAEGGSHLSATTGTRIADGNTPHTVSATLVDQYGNPVPDIEVDFALAEGLAVAAGGSTTVSTNESGVAALDVVSSTAGTYDVTASVGGVQIVNGSPATVAFSAGVVDMSQSSFTISPEGPLAAGSGAESTYTGVVQARDAGGNPVSGVTVVITAEPTVAEQPLVGTTDADGRMAVDFTSTVAQTSRLTAYLTVNGTAQPLPALNRTWIAGAPDLTEDGKSTLSATSGSRLADGAAAHTLTATVRDSLGNPVSGAEVAFQLPGGGIAAAGGGSTTKTTNSAGVAELNVVSTTAGSFDVTATVNGEPLLNGSPATVTFVTGSVSAADSTLTVAPEGPLSVGREGDNTYTATVLAQDANGNPVPTTAVTFEVRDAAGNVVTEPRLTQLSAYADENGNAVTTVNSTLAGEFTLRALIDGQLVGGQGAKVVWTAGAASAETSAMTVTPGAVEADGQSAHRATVKVTDAYGNPVEGATVAFGVADGPQLSAPTAVSGANGVATVDITSTQAGEFAVTAAIDGTEVSGSGQTVEFVNGAASATASSWTVTPEGPLPAGEAFTAVVQVNDANGNPVSGATIGLDLPTGITVAESGPYVSDAEGKVTLTLTSEIAGEYPVSVTLGADRIGETKTLVFTAGEASTSESSIAATSPVQANGTDTSTVTVTLKDGFGNVVTDEYPVSVTTTVGTATAAVPNGDGTYTATVSSLTPGTATISFTIDGAVADDSATVEFVATPSTPVVNPSNGKDVTGQIDPGATVRLEDGQGNEIPGSLVVDPDGSFTFVPSLPLEDGTEVVVTAVDENGYESDPALVVVDAVAPA
ncbi:Ig-like domain-containing protein, partial [Cellulomonas denverensis]